MDQKYTSYTQGQKQRNNTNASIPTNNNYTISNQNIDYDKYDKLTTEKALRNKLDSAFSDLDSLRQSLKEIKSKATITQDRQRFINISPSPPASPANKNRNIRNNIRSKSRHRGKKISLYDLIYQ